MRTLEISKCENDIDSYGEIRNNCVCLEFPHVITAPHRVSRRFRNVIEYNELFEGNIDRPPWYVDYTFRKSLLLGVTPSRITAYTTKNRRRKKKKKNFTRRRKLRRATWYTNGTSIQDDWRGLWRHWIDLDRFTGRYRHWALWSSIPIVYNGF